MRLVCTFALLLIFSIGCFAQNMVKISGRVSDFNGKPVPTCKVELKHADFTTAYETYTDKNGFYTLEVAKGRYAAMLVVKLAEYPFSNDPVSEGKQRLQFWAWNVIADRDLLINPHYHRLELYGVNAFTIIGGSPGYTIYVRPMSLSKFQSFPKQERANANMSVEDGNLDVSVFIDEEAVKVNQIQRVQEYFPGTQLDGFLIHVDFPKKKADKPYHIFRIEAADKSTGDKGEAFYFHELRTYM